jgi:hypothetical protein
MRAACFLIVISIFLFSCSNVEQHTHLPPEVMERVLMDMQMADVYSVMTQPDSITVNARNMDSLTDFYAGILKHHNLTEEQFASSMKWYEEHPEELEEIYNRINKKLAILAGKSE